VINRRIGNGNVRRVRFALGKTTDEMGDPIRHLPVRRGSVRCIRLQHPALSQLIAQAGLSHHRVNFDARNPCQAPPERFHRSPPESHVAFEQISHQKRDCPQRLLGRILVGRQFDDHYSVKFRLFEADGIELGRVGSGSGEPVQGHELAPRKFLPISPDEFAAP